MIPNNRKPPISEKYLCIECGYPFDKDIHVSCNCPSEDTPTKPTGSVEEMALQYAIAENDRRGYVKGHNGETKDAFKAGHAQATAEWKELHDNDETCINNMLREMKSLQTKLDVAMEALKRCSDGTQSESPHTIQPFSRTMQVAHEALATINEDKKG